MDNQTYQQLHDLPKELDNPNISVAAPFSQVILPGRGKFVPKKKFIVIQNRKGHHRKNNLSYLLRSNSGTLIRIDINGKTHSHVPTPHVHIFDEAHQNGVDAFPLAKLKNYLSQSTDVSESLLAFLDYNNFETKNLIFSKSLV